MPCYYCDNPGVAYAGSRPIDLEGLCGPHSSTHRTMTRLWASVLPAGQQPRWRYFAHKGWLYGWSTERVADGKFAAFIYRPDGDQLVLAKEQHFGLRRAAKARAASWHSRAKQTASGRPPASMLR